MNITSRLAVCFGMAFAFAQLPSGESAPKAAQQAVAAPPKPVAGQSRALLVAGDPLRGSFVGWARGPVDEDGAGPLPEFTQGWFGQPDWDLVAANGTTAPLPRLDPGKDRTWWDPTFHGEVLIPLGTKPGKYVIRAGPVEWPIEVVALPKRSKGETTLAAGATVAAAQKLVDAGYRVIRFSGEYAWDKPLDLSRAPGIVLTGKFSSISYSGEQPKEGFVNLIIGGEWVVLKDLTFDGPSWVRPIAQDSAPNLTLVGVTFTGGCGLNAPGPGLYAERCLIDGGGVFAGGYGGLFRRCHFREIIAGHSFTAWAADHNLAHVDCLWERTERGPMFQLNWGDVAGNLFLGAQVERVVASEGGSESFGCEPAFEETTPVEQRPKFAFKDNLILHYRYTAGAGGGSAIQWDGHATGNLVRDVKANGGSGLILWGGGVSRNVFEGVELSNGAGIRLRPGATDNLFRRCIVSSSHPAGPNMADPYAIFESGLDVRSMVYWDRPPGPGNRFEQVAFWVSDPFRPVQDPAPLTWDRCSLNGQPFAVVKPVP